MGDLLRVKGCWITTGQLLHTLRVDANHAANAISFGQEGKIVARWWDELDNGRVIHYIKAV